MNELPIRIVVRKPPPGVAVQVQRGPSELVAPSRRTSETLAFDLTVRLGRPQGDGRPNFLGPLVQGTPTDRFVYVNAGSRAGQSDSCWDRRAKVKLGGITWDLIEAVRRQPGAVLEAQIAGTAGDGGPACATVQLLEPGWRIVMGTAPEPAKTDRTGIHMGSAAPTFLVADVGGTGRWYAEHLGFQMVGTFPESEPYAYASLQRDGVEIMLLGLADYRKPDLTGHRPEGLWDAYVRMRGVESFYESLRGQTFIKMPLTKQSYGDREFEVRDPNGYVLVFSEGPRET